MTVPYYTVGNAQYTGILLFIELKYTVDTQFKCMTIPFINTYNSHLFLSRLTPDKEEKDF